MNSFTLELPVAASPDRVWRALTEGSELTQWLCEDANIKQEPGGEFELFWDLSNPNVNSTKGCKILAIDGDRSLKYQWKGPDQFSGLMNNPPRTFVEITLQDKGGETIVGLTHSGWGTGPAWDQALAWHKAVWSNALMALKALVENS
jgi:uncharacterized protein YndB with AHSA1/START domain